MQNVPIKYHFSEIFTSLFQSKCAIEPKLKLKKAKMLSRSAEMGVYSLSFLKIVMKLNLVNEIHSKCVFLLVSTVECLSFTVHNDVREEFDTRRLFSHLSAQVGKFLCAHLKSDFKMCTY